MKPVIITEERLAEIEARRAKRIEAHKDWNIPMCWYDYDIADLIDELRKEIEE